MTRITTSMPSSSCGMPNEKRALPVSWSMPTRPSARPRNRLNSPRVERGAEQRRHGAEREHREAEVLGRAESQRHRRQQRREERQRDRGERARDERADGRGGERRRAAPLPRHLMAVDGGGDRAGFAGRVEQDAGRRSAVHRAVVDPAEHDEGADRIEGERDREEHRDGQRRPDAGQHADGGAEGHAGERPHQMRQRSALAKPSVASAPASVSIKDGGSEPAPEHARRQRQLQQRARTAGRRRPTRATANAASRAGWRSSNARATNQKSTAEAMTKPARSASARLRAMPSAISAERPPAAASAPRRSRG